MKDNEDSRVKIPGLFHLKKLGCEYLSLKDALWDEQYNVFTDIFLASMSRINDNFDVHPTNTFTVLN